MNKSPTPNSSHTSTSLNNGPTHGLKNRQIIVAVSGGIAAYKVAELVRLLIKQNAAVRVVMTDNATKFITPLTFQALTGNPVHADLMSAEAESAMDHIALARWADAIIVAPATANTLARIAHGFSDDLLTTLILATSAPIFLAPAMNQQMWANNATQHNLSVVKQRGIAIIGPGHGEQACGDIGAGRMVEPIAIQKEIEHFFEGQIESQCEGQLETKLENRLDTAVDRPLLQLQQKHVVITAGPTQEGIDPIRFLSNRSSGKMGFALAEAAYIAGAKVTLISGPVHLPTPEGVGRINVKSASDMLKATEQACSTADLFIAAAAVADYTPTQQAPSKIKKSDDNLTLHLTRTQDILATISTKRASLDEKPFCVGFAAETENVLEYAKGKLNKKRLNMVVANDVSQTGIGFASDQNQVTIISQKEQVTVPISSKSVIAQQIIETIAIHLKSRTSQPS